MKNVTEITLPARKLGGETIPERTYRVQRRPDWSVPGVNAIQAFFTSDRGRQPREVRNWETLALLQEALDLAEAGR